MLTEGGVTHREHPLGRALEHRRPGRAARQAGGARAARVEPDDVGGATGAGIAVAANYLWYTDPNFDSGLCDTLESGGGATRPAYATWGGLPSFA